MTTIASALPRTEPLAVETHSAAVYFCREFSRLVTFAETELPTVLVAGCGAGHEAAYIAECLPAAVQAIDVEHAPDPEFLSRPNLHFQAGSVEQLEFAAETFDAVFYHHVIEHVRDPERSLVEIARVLRPGGWMFIGTPNRHRLISAAGAHRQRDWSPTLRSKLRENWQDWRARLQGRFRNELGAHAGFATGELDDLLAKYFVERRWVTAEYLRHKYGGHRFSALVRLATSELCCGILAPSIYAFCQKA